MFPCHDGRREDILSQDAIKEAAQSPRRRGSRTARGRSRGSADILCIDYLITSCQNAAAAVIHHSGSDVFRSIAHLGPFSSTLSAFLSNPAVGWLYSSVRAENRRHKQSLREAPQRLPGCLSASADVLLRKTPTCSNRSILRRFHSSSVTAEWERRPVDLT